MKPTSILRVCLAILLVICLFKMPYGYYQFVRFASSVGFGFLAYEALQVQRKNLAIAFVVLLILFQPLAKISLGRELWNVVDVIVAIFLILVELNSKKINNND